MGGPLAQVGSFSSSVPLGSGPPAASSSIREGDPSSVGMMEGAFFVGRSELLEWVNSSLLLSLSRIEDCASGCVYLQTLDCLLGPRSRVPMCKVKWGARHEYEYIQNYKLLQAAFDAHAIQKHIDVGKLVKAKYQDNLEFLQWLKAFCDRQAAVYAYDVPYDPIERRKLGIGPFPSWAPVGPPGQHPPPSKKHAAAAYASSTAAASSSSNRCRLQQQQQQPQQQQRAAAASTTAPTGPLQKRQHMQQQQQQLGRAGSGAAAAAAATAAAVETLQNELQQAILERDFYYSKLRKIELLCGAPGAQSLTVKELLAILYAREEEPTFEGPIDQP
ncbi:hypothetical protein Emed_001220 [Eimeria media]